MTVVAENPKLYAKIMRFPSLRFCCPVGLRLAHNSTDIGQVSRSYEVSASRAAW